MSAQNAYTPGNNRTTGKLAGQASSRRPTTPPPTPRQGRYSTLRWIKPAGDTEWRQVWLKTPEDRIRQAVDAVLLQAGYDPDDDPHYPGNPDLLERLRQQRRQLIDHYQGVAARNSTDGYDPDGL